MNIKRPWWMIRDDLAHRVRVRVTEWTALAVFMAEIFILVGLATAVVFAGIFTIYPSLRTAWAMWGW